MNGSDSKAIAAELKKNAGWVIGFGIILLLLGIFAILTPLIPGLVVTLGVGIFLLVASATEILHGLRSGSWKTGAFHFISGLLAFLGGLLMILHPVKGLDFLTLLLAVYFFADGISACVQAWNLRPLRGWGWMLFAGSLSLLLGILTIAEWPLTADWLVGTYIGVKLFFTGSALIALGSAARQ
ncbi:MAG: HdeD family acid-resistance protein [Planctomycetota bacterium]